MNKELYKKWLKDTLPRLEEWANSDEDDNGPCPLSEDPAGWICAYIKGLEADQSLKRELVEALEESRQFTCGYSEKTFDSHGLRKHYEKVKALITRAEAQ